MTRPRSSPDKPAGKTETSQSANNNENRREATDEAVEGLGVDLEAIEIHDRDEEVEGGMYGNDAPEDEEEDEEERVSSSPSFASNAATNDEEKGRQRHSSSVQRVEHLHRFSLPAPTPMNGEVAPIVNVLPGPVLPLPGSVPQGFEIPATSSGATKGAIGPPVSAGYGVFPTQAGAAAGGGGGTKFTLNRNADVKAKKTRNLNNGGPVAEGGSGAGSGASGFPTHSGSPRSSASLWGSRGSQANLLSHPMHVGSANGGGGVVAGGSNHLMPDAETSPLPRRRNMNQLSSSNADHSNPLPRPSAAQNPPQNNPSEQQQQQVPQHQQQQQQFPSAQYPAVQHQPSNFAQQPQNQREPPQHNLQQQPQQLNQPQQQLNQPQNQQQQQHPPPAQRQDNEAADRPNPFDLNNEMELGIGHMLKDRMASLCANELLADVEFIVGTPEGAVAAGAALVPPMGGGVRSIPAHKCILVTSSSVFYAMFCGGLASRSKDGDEIRVPDVDPEAFMAMLRYIYCEEINLEPESVLPTLYAAKKYMVNPLANECINYLEKNLKPENVCVILMQSKLYDEEELAEKCLREIDMHTEEVLNSEGFLEVDHDTLQSLVVRDGLSIPEIRLFEAVVRWAAAECLRRGLEPTPEQKRQMLGPVLHLIRVPTISLTDFSNHVSKSGLLTPEECVRMFQYFTADDKPGNLDFICEPRRKVGTERRCRRFPYFLHVSSTFYGLHSIAFKASRKVAIVGFGLYGWAQGCACHVVTAQLMYQGNVIAETHQRITAHCPEDEPTYRVKFDNPVEINADVLYSACVILNGAQSYYGMDGKERCEADGVTFVFLNSMDGSNGTNVEHGQIPEIIFTEPH